MEAGIELILCGCNLSSMELSLIWMETVPNDFRRRLFLNMFNLDLVQIFAPNQIWL